jgi:hypothetical protein
LFPKQIWLEKSKLLQKPSYKQNLSSESGWQWYTSGGTAPDYYDSTAPWRMTAANTYPVLKGAAYTELHLQAAVGGSYTPSTYNIIANCKYRGYDYSEWKFCCDRVQANLKFTIKPDTSYIIQDVLVDGISVGAVMIYLHFC